LALWHGAALGAILSTPPCRLRCGIAPDRNLERNDDKNCPTKDDEPVVADQLREKLIKIGAKIVLHRRYATFHLAEVSVPRQMFADILSLIARLRAPPAQA